MQDSSTQSAVCAATDGPDATRALAAALADQMTDGDLIVLTGDLGAGKTCFTQGLGRGLGIEDRITSPTFTLASQYEGRLVLDHLDVYRIEQLTDTLDLDLPELLEVGVTVIEWGEQILPALPADHLMVAVRYGEGDDDRRLRLSAGGPMWAERLPTLAQVIAPWVVPC